MIAGTVDDQEKLKVEYDAFGFVKDNVCPKCGGPLKEGHVDDVGTLFFKCEKCGEQTSAPKIAAPKTEPPKQPEIWKKEGPVCGNCKRRLTRDSGCDNSYYISQGTILRSDPPCEKFLGKNDYEIADGSWIAKVHLGLVQVFEGGQPRYTTQLSKLASPGARKAMAKALNLEDGTVDRVATEILANHPPGKKDRQQRNVKVVTSQGAEEVEPIVLDHLTMIEDPAVANLPVIVEAVVSSTSISYLVPKTIQAFVTDKNGVEDAKAIEIGDKNTINIKFVAVNEDIKYRRLKRFVEEAVDQSGSKIRIEEQKWRTIYRIRVRPPVFTLEKREGKIVDERGFEYKSYDVYVCADKSITFQASSLIRLKGIVLPSPHSQNTTLLVYEVEFPEEFRSFNVEKLEKLKGRFSGLTVQQRVDWVLSNFEKFSQIIGRRNLALEGFLTFFTPTHIQLNGKVERGWGNVADVGDTTTGKSETVKKLILLLRAGMLITAETASAVGLVGTAVQSEKGQWTVEWGFLVLNDRKLLAIDGAHKLPFSQWAALSESERSGVVTIAKAAKNSAYARTRLIKIANAVDREQDKFCTKSMKSFLYPIQALSTVFDKTGIARLDLAVFADSRDVKAEQVNKQLDSNYDEDLELLADALRWCWSNTAKVEFTPEAATQILKSATTIYEKFFCDSVPLTSIDMKWKLARLSAALAFMTVSTEDCKVVTVSEEHVKAIVGFIDEEYSRAGLNTLAQEDKYETMTQEDVDKFIANAAYRAGIDHDKVVEILKFIVLQGRVTKDQLKNKFDLAENNQARPLLAVLESEKLLRGGRGYYPTSKLVEAYKILTRLTRLTPSEKEAPTKTEENKTVEKNKTQENMTPSFSDPVKDVKRVKTEESEGNEKSDLPLSGSGNRGKQGNITVEDVGRPLESDGEAAVYVTQNQTAYVSHIRTGEPCHNKCGLASEWLVEHDPDVRLCFCNGCFRKAKKDFEKSGFKIEFRMEEEGGKS